MRLTRTTPQRLIVALGISVPLTFVACSRTSQHELAAERYAEFAEAYKSATEGKEPLLTTCYGEQWSDHAFRVGEDLKKHAEDHAYLTNKSLYYKQLSENEKAASGPAGSKLHGGKNRNP